MVVGMGGDDALVVSLSSSVSFFNFILMILLFHFMPKTNETKIKMKEMEGKLKNHKGQRCDDLMI
jgi:hypothetical protein